MAKFKGQTPSASIKEGNGEAWKLSKALDRRKLLCACYGREAQRQRDVKTQGQRRNEEVISPC